MDYKEYLRSGHWKKTRRAALARAGYRCQICNAGNVQLEVHHRTYDRLGREFDADLTVLCDGCHGKFHDELPDPPVERWQGNAPRQVEDEDDGEWIHVPAYAEEGLRRAANDGMGRWVEAAWFAMRRALGLSVEDSLESVSKELNGGGHTRKIEYP